MGKNSSVANEEYYNRQNKYFNCGPTACSIAAAKLLGRDPEKLETQFTNSLLARKKGKKYKGMDWDLPAKWLRPLNLQVQQKNSLTPAEIHDYIKKGAVVIASVTPKSKLTSGGHITALVESQNT